MTKMSYKKMMSLQNAVAKLCDLIVPGRHDQDAIDLNRLAKELGVIDVLYRASRIHGYTQWGQRGATLTLAMAKTEGRRRSTLAHEIAHLLLNPALKPDETIDRVARALSRELLGSDIDCFQEAIETVGIERVCDLVAFELLLPERRARSLDAQRIANASELSACAAQLRISLALLVNQTNKTGVSVQLVRLTQAWNGGWIAVDTAGAHGSWHVGASADVASGYRLSALPHGDQSHLVELHPEGHSTPDVFSACRKRGTVVAVRNAAAAHPALDETTTR